MAFTLRQLQQLIRDTYDAKDRRRGVEGTFMWFMEEVGELASALRGGSPEERAAEFADVLAWLATLLVVYSLALPLYLFKAFVLPRQAMWPITLIFIASIYPARVLTGWAYHRAQRRCSEGVPSHRGLRWLARLAMIPILVVFVFLLHFTQFIGANGTAGLFEHHAFLLPWAGAPPE